jgi:hypothetical protein
MVWYILSAIAVFLVIRLNIWYHRETAGMSPEERKAEDDEMQIW